ncbi:hypothetical protein L204_103946 [Cryptococcus depauperatus]|nr:hypothetical protein L204_03099 [Cryptococcus depauperatus CBS 7855]
MTNSVPETTDKKEPRSNNFRHDKAANPSKHLDLQMRGGSEILSPSNTTYNPETPQVASPNVSTLNTSLAAVHGSMATTPFRQGANRHSDFPKWGRAVLRKREENAKVLFPQLDDPAIKMEAVSANNAMTLTPVYNTRIIAIDFDDVCTQNMLTIVSEHNKIYGTDLTLDDLETYIFWQNRGWGTHADVARKFKTLNQLLSQTSPIPGVANALQILHSFGHPIHMVTSRPETDREAVIDWLQKEGITIGTQSQDTIEAIWFTGSFSFAYPELGSKGDTESAIEREKNLNRKLKEIWKESIGQGRSGLAKLRILRQINASLLIDDHHGDIEPMLKADLPIPCILFGEYGWNRSRSGVSSPTELMHYEERTSKGLEIPCEAILTGKDHGLYRARTWEDVLEWVKEWDRDAERGL